MCFLWLDIQTRCPTHVLKPNVNRGQNPFPPTVSLSISEMIAGQPVACGSSPHCILMRLLLTEAKDFKGQHIWLLIPYHFEESTSHWLIWTQWRVNFHSTSCLCVCKCTVGKTQETASLIWKCSHKLFHIPHSYMHQTQFFLRCWSPETVVSYCTVCLSEHPAEMFFHLPFAWRAASCKEYGNAERDSPLRKQTPHRTQIRIESSAYTSTHIIHLLSWTVWE